MKRIITVLLFGMLIAFGCVQEPQEPVACTAEAKLCPDGSAVGRVAPDCEFEACPETKTCDALTPCETGECYKFEDEETAICFEGDPCSRCPLGECYILESYPMQIRCVDEEDEEESICEDLCGDGICQEIVCLATGCPCAETRESCARDCLTETEPEPEPEAEPEVETENEMGLQYCDEAECPQDHTCKLLQTEERPTCIPSADIFRDCDMCSSGKCYIYSYSPLALKCLAEEQ